MPPEATIICANLACRVAETGKCVEGLALAECPHYGRPQTSVAGAPTIDPERTGLPLPPADRLSVTAAGEVLRAHRTQVIAVVGPFDAGKTSLIASLYDLLQTGPVGGFAFARSRTLHAFERACHHARAASLRVVPTTDRTPIGAVEFYHLGLGAPDRGIIDVLLGDRAGEEYVRAFNNPPSTAEFPEIRRADVLTLLVDGERLLDVGMRHNVCSEAEMALQAMLDGGTALPQQRVAVVLTKLDAVRASPARARAEADFAKLHANLRRLYASRFATLDAFMVAASPKDVSLQRGHGVSELLRTWIDAPVALPPRPQSSASSIRAFARLLETD